MSENKLEKITSWAKRRGFIIPSSEIYGGLGGIYDFGSLGVALKNNIKNLWWKTFVEDRTDIVGIESAILMNRLVWQASGHEKGFIDELVECKKCHSRFRLNEIGNSKSEILNPKQIQNSKSEITAKAGSRYGGTNPNNQILKCPQGGEHEYTQPKKFNPMFKTFVGSVEDSAAQTYLRPETAQGMFVNFKQILEVSHQKIPFGIAQIGKSFRNEINTKDYLFRIREFEMAEIEYFVKPSDDEKSFENWLKEWQDFVLSLGIKKENIKLYEHSKEALSHYSKRTVDLNYNFPFGWKELAGVANRTDFDLKSHEKASGKDMKYYDEEAKEKYWPYVIEPTLGIERLMLAIICDAFEEVKPRTTTTKAATEKEIILHFNPKIAPVKVAVLPLIKKSLTKKAQKVYDEVRSCFPAVYDETGSIGRRYRRQDEIGTPVCVTIDFETLKDDSVTIRDRDTMKQDRIKIAELNTYIFDKLNK